MWARAARLDGQRVSPLWNGMFRLSTKRAAISTLCPPCWVFALLPRNRCHGNPKNRANRCPRGNASPRRLPLTSLAAKEQYYSRSPENSTVPPFYFLFSFIFLFDCASMSTILTYPAINFPRRAWSFSR